MNASVRQRPFLKVFYEGCSISDVVTAIPQRGCEPPLHDFARYSPQRTRGKAVYSVGDRITFVCKGEEYARENNFAECQSNGKWSRKPSCSSKFIYFYGLSMKLSTNAVNRISIKLITKL